MWFEAVKRGLCLGEKRVQISQVRVPRVLVGPVRFRSMLYSQLPDHLAASLPAWPARAPALSWGPWEPSIATVAWVNWQPDLDFGSC